MKKKNQSKTIIILNNIRAHTNAQTNKINANNQNNFKHFMFIWRNSKQN